MSEILSKGSKYNGFEVLDTYEIKDFHSTAVHLRHSKTGLEVLHLVNDEQENQFAFAFRTPNPKGNGAAHIMEHSVLCGSEKFPLKDPFTQLANQSVKTYLNAATYPERTIYPGSSVVEADYFNLMNVYGDAVFFPSLSPEVFSQEAHRLEIDEEGKPSVQGVVYNEMKGSYSSFVEIAMDVPVRNILKGSIYEKDSGGNPAEIPELTYEEYLAFHEKWYRPENCFVFLYGNIPTTKQLDFLQEKFLTRLENKNPDLKWTPAVKQSYIDTLKKYATPAPVSEPLFVKAEGPAGEGSEQEKGNTVYITWNLGVQRSALENMEIVFLTAVLLNHDGSPLKKALVECHLGEDTAPGAGLSAMYNTLFTIGLRGVKKDDTQKVKDVVFDTLKKVVEDGISQEDISSVLMGLEFTHREIRRSHGPYSLVIMQAPVYSWSFGFDIKKSFRLRRDLEEISSRIKTQPGYLEKLVEKYFLNNKNYILAEIKPSKKFTSNREKAEKALVEKLMQNTTVEAVKTENDKLHQYQSSKDDTSCLPHLSPKDFIVEGKRITDNITIRCEKLKGADGSDVDYFVSSENTNGVTYFDFGFPADVLSPEDYKYLPLFSETVTECGWGDLDYTKAAEVCSLSTGGFAAALLINQATEKSRSKEYVESHPYCNRAWLCFKMKVLDEKIKDGLELLADCINKVDFKDSKRLKDIAVECRNDFESSVIPGGHIYSTLRASRKLDKTAAIDELWNGLSQLFVTKELADQKPEVYAEIFRRILKELRAGGGFVHITAEEETIKASKADLEDFINKIGLTSLKDPKPSTAEDFIKLTEIDGEVPEGENEIYIIPSQVGYAAEVFKGIPFGTKNHAIEEIIGHWMSNILLWERVRTIGGAYGVFCDPESITGAIQFVTYRDPTPEKSNDVFEQCLKEAAEMDFTQDELDKAIMGNFSHFIVPKPPRSRGYTGLLRVLYGISDEDREGKVLEQLNCTTEQFKETLKNLSDFSSRSKHRVIFTSKKDSVSGKITVLPL